MRTDVREVRERLIAIEQYMQDMFIGPDREGRLHLPGAANEQIYEAQKALGRAGELLHRIDPGAVGGERVLHEAPSPNEMLARRARAAFCPGPTPRANKQSDEEAA